MKMVTLLTKDIIPYANNPRNNDAAVDAVAESIKQCSYIQPIIIDEDHVILAGHTRLKALLKLNVEKCECILVEGLSDSDKRKYRILDNKTAEMAEWDLRKLEEELEGLDLGELDFFNMTNEPFEVNDEIGYTGATEYDAEAFGDEQFKYHCQNCGFNFN